MPEVDRTPKNSCESPPLLPDAKAAFHETLVARVKNPKSFPKVSRRVLGKALCRMARQKALVSDAGFRYVERKTGERERSADNPWERDARIGGGYPVRHSIPALMRGAEPMCSGRGVTRTKGPGRVPVPGVRCVGEGHRPSCRTRVSRLSKKAGGGEPPAVQRDTATH